jgi:hypothetical protein
LVEPGDFGVDLSDRMRRQQLADRGPVLGVHQFGQRGARAGAGSIPSMTSCSCETSCVKRCGAGRFAVKRCALCPSGSLR